MENSYTNNNIFARRILIAILMLIIVIVFCSGYNYSKKYTIIDKNMYIPILKEDYDKYTSKSLLGNRLLIENNQKDTAHLNETLVKQSDVITKVQTDLDECRRLRLRPN